MLLLLCIAAFLLQVGYLGWMMAGWPTPQSEQRHPNANAELEVASLPPITVVIAVRNEHHRLPELAAALQQQTHPQWHLVWVNDHSTDGTAAWLDAHANRHAHVQVVHHEAPPGKKQALDAGVRVAKTDLLAFTDADCTPPPTWLATLARHHASTDVDTVYIGPSLPVKPRGVLQRLAGYETWTATLAMGAAAQHGHAYMAVGRNLSYPVSIYAQVEGHTAHDELLSGDDDLFVQAARAEGVPCRPVWDPTAHVATASPTTWRRWLHAQRRHTSTGRAYATAPALHLTAYYTSALVVWAAPLLIGSVGAGLLALRLIGVGHLLHRGSAVLSVPAPTLGFPVWDAGHTVLRIGTSIAGWLAPPSRWE